jgi:predicted nucleic acid-binding protein
MTINLGYLDTNIFVHNLHPKVENYARCREIITALEEGRATGRLDATVVYELTFILARSRRFPDRPAIAEYVQSILTMTGVIVEDLETLKTALERWATRGVGFADAWLFARALADETSVCTANARDFPGVRNTFYE